jgi:hypothetical protein
MIQRIPVKNAMRNDDDYLLQGETIDVVPDDRDVYVDPQQGRSYDTSQGVAMRDLPQSGVIRLPRVTYGEQR